MPAADPALTALIPPPERLWFMDNVCTVRLPTASNPEGLSMMEFEARHGFGPPFHVHHDEDETFHVLSGRIRVKLADAVGELGAGEVLFAPRDVPHSFRVISPEGVRLMTVTCGGQFERMVRSMSRPAGPGRPPQVEVTPELAERLRLACEAERITLLGPPID